MRSAADKTHLLLNQPAALTGYPLVPGHEIVGHVTAIGSAVTSHAVGDTVAVGCMVDMRPEPCSAHRRCLRVLKQHPDLAFAARRLHVSQEALKAMVVELNACYGDALIRLEAGRVHVSNFLTNSQP